MRKRGLFLAGEHARVPDKKDLPNMVKTSPPIALSEPKRLGNGVSLSRSISRSFDRADHSMEGRFKAA
jgi:hypothetical protein